MFAAFVLFRIETVDPDYWSGLLFGMVDPITSDRVAVDLGATIRKTTMLVIWRTSDYTCDIRGITQGPTATNWLRINPISLVAAASLSGRQPARRHHFGGLVNIRCVDAAEEGETYHWPMSTWTMSRRTVGTIGNKLRSAAQQGQDWAKQRPLAIDIGVAILAFGIALSELNADALVGARSADWIGVALIATAALALVWRRSATKPMAFVVSATLIVVYSRGYPTYVASIGLPAVFAVAAYIEDRRRAWMLSWAMTAILMFSASLSVLQVSGEFNSPDATSMLLTIIGAIAAGLFVRDRAELILSTQARAERAETDRLAETQRAVTRERLRIAREMHDIVAHGMSLIAVQAAAAQQITHTKPERAVELMESIEATGRESLTEMRRMLGILRTEGDHDGEQVAADRAPQPTLNDVEPLVTSCTKAGTPTTLRVEGEQRPIGAGIELAAFRVVQEALTNVIKHGGSAATAKVRIIFEDEALLLIVTDTGSGIMLEDSSSGNGLVGMRERVEAYRGSITTGPRPGGGFGVEVSLPLSPDNHRSIQSTVSSNPPVDSLTESSARRQERTSQEIQT